MSEDVKSFTIINRLGLHARAASQLVQEANKYNSDIFVSRESHEVNGKSIMGILMLAATCGSEVTVKAIGSDSEVAIAGIGDLITRGFDEELGEGY